jgi:hypothetical protein
MSKIRDLRFLEWCYEESDLLGLHGVDWLIVTEDSEECNDYIFRV